MPVAFWGEVTIGNVAVEGSWWRWTTKHETPGQGLEILSPGFSGGGGGGEQRLEKHKRAKAGTLSGWQIPQVRRAWTWASWLKGLLGETIHTAQTGEQEIVEGL